MRITSVRVRKLVTGPGYNNYACEAEAAVQDGEDADDVRQQLTDWVKDQIEREKGIERMYERSQDLVQILADREREVKWLEAVIASANAVIGKHDELRQLAIKAKLEIPGLNILGDDLPF